MIAYFSANNSDKSLKKKLKRNSDLVHDIAPGERKKLTNWIREVNHDRKAFPELFPDGKCGLHDKNRKRKISATQNYNHKVINKSCKYAGEVSLLRSKATKVKCL